MLVGDGHVAAFDEGVAGHSDVSVQVIGGEPSAVLELLPERAERADLRPAVQLVLLGLGDLGLLAVVPLLGALVGAERLLSFLAVHVCGHPAEDRGRGGACLLREFAGHSALGDICQLRTGHVRVGADDLPLHLGGDEFVVHAAG